MRILEPGGAGQAEEGQQLHAGRQDQRFPYLRRLLPSATETQVHRIKRVCVARSTSRWYVCCPRPACVCAVLQSRAFPARFTHEMRALSLSHYWWHLFCSIYRHPVPPAHTESNPSLLYTSHFILP